MPMTRPPCRRRLRSSRAGEAKFSPCALWFDMTEANSPSMWERSTLVRFFRWLFSWRGVRRILIVLAWTATIIALLYAEENWRGRRKWNTTRKQLEARGEQLDF